MLISIKDLNFTNTGMKDTPRSRIQEHNSSIGSTSTASSHLCPYTLFFHICSFSGCCDLLSYIQRAWKEKNNRMIGSAIQDTKAWKNYDGEVISEFDIKNYGMTASEMIVINIFNIFKLKWCLNSHCEHLT